MASENIKDKLIDNPLSLRIVSIEDVIPHEYIDSRRVKKLINKINVSTAFTNPIIVMENEDKYIILDGATRFTAFKTLGFSHIIVQVISDKDNIILDRWFHAIRKIDTSKLIKLLNDIPEISIIESGSDEAMKGISGFNELCYLYLIDDGKVYYIKPAQDVNHLDALNTLTHAYIKSSHVTRTTTINISTLIDKYSDFTALMVFPKYEVEQILQFTNEGKIFPAGITRFLIPGRVMRINADLNYLKSDKSLFEKNEWLNELIMEKFANDSVRYYNEPVYLLDE
jgi:L-serine kinase (ATP) / ParB family transcriptional regulator, heme-responsive regulator